MNGTSALVVDGERYQIHRIDSVGAAQLPYTIRVLVENALRHGRLDDASMLAAWRPDLEMPAHVAFSPARVLLQDSTGIPVLIDLAALRDAVAAAGGDPALATPRVPVDLVVDHSLIAEFTQRPDAVRLNVELEFRRNRERYSFLRWNQSAYSQLRVVPPNTGIVHQVNLEHLADVVTVRRQSSGATAMPDTLVGTDSHTTMVNSLGIVGWGVGGIEAEMAIIGQPLPVAVPEVVGVRLLGDLSAGATTTDLVLTLTEQLRARDLVGSFIEFFGPGLDRIAVETRATIANMAPEFGCTAAMFPIDDLTVKYLRLTGRDDHHVRLVEAYAKEQGLFGEPDSPPAYSRELEIDLAAVEPSIAGPSRPHDRTPLRTARTAVDQHLRRELAREGVPWSGRDPAPSVQVDTGGQRFELEHGHVVLAAITSCTNTSNPSVMLAAALLAKRAVERGLVVKPWVKTSLAPGSRVVVDYYRAAGLLPYLERLGFHVVGYGCASCGGKSGTLQAEISDAIRQNGLAVAAVLSGNRNFDGRIHPDCRFSYLMSPPLVVAYALAGTMRVGLATDPLGTDESGQPVYLHDLWPTEAEIAQVLERHIGADLFRTRYADVFTGDRNWAALEVPAADRPAQGRFPWDPSSTTIRRPPFLDALPKQPEPLQDILGARALLVLGDSISTDHISPTGRIPRDSPAGRYLTEQGVSGADLGTFSSRRGNHDVMVRGTFTNRRLQNLLTPQQAGGVSRYLPAELVMPVFDVSASYAVDDVPVVVLAGRQYGQGSSRDWAAKGTALLGVRAVLAESFERIHRANLAGMGVWPLQLPAPLRDLGLSGTESFTIAGLSDIDGGREAAPACAEVTATSDDGAGVTFPVEVRVDGAQEFGYLRHGGVLPYMWRQLITQTS